MPRQKKIYSLSVQKASSLIQSRKLSVAVVGCGYIGSCIAAILAHKGIRTTGIDVNRKLVADMQKGRTILHEPGLKKLVRDTVRSGKLRATTDFRAVQDADIVIITVGTPLSERYAADMSHISAASRSVASYLRKGHLIILKSTLLPGATEGLVRMILEKSGLKAGVDFGLVFSPERLSEGNAIAELLSIPIIVGGHNEKSAELTGLFWELALGVRTIRVENAKAAEMAKLADNAWIDLSIAIGNEIGVLCGKLGVDAMEVIRAANTLPKGGSNVNILQPSMGVGGYCLTKDPWFLHHMSKKLGVEMRTPVVSRNVNDAMPAYTFRLIERSLARQGKKLKNSKVAVLGLAYKSDTGDCRFTPTTHVLRRLEKSGCRLSVFDPLVSRSDARTVTKVSMARSLKDAVVGADCVALFTGHKQFKKFPLKRLRGFVNAKCSIIDGRNMYSRNAINRIKKLGFIYYGIGRT